MCAQELAEFTCCAGCRLLLLSAELMHGYQIMQAMSGRTGGAWHLSWGAIYPTIAQLEDEGLVMTREEGGRRLVTFTFVGRGRLEGAPRPTRRPVRRLRGCLVGACACFTASCQVQHG